MFPLCIYCETQVRLWALSLHTRQVVIVTIKYRNVFSSDMEISVHSACVQALLSVAECGQGHLCL